MDLNADLDVLRRSSTKKLAFQKTCVSIESCIEGVPQNCRISDIQSRSTPKSIQPLVATRAWTCPVVGPGCNGGLGDRHSSGLRQQLKASNQGHSSAPQA